MSEQDWIDIRGLRFPAHPSILTGTRRNDLEEASHNAGIARRLVSLARSDDRALVIGAGAGVLPAILAGRVGLRHVHVIEPETALQTYLNDLCDANGLFRVTVSDTPTCPFVPTLLVADLTETGGVLPGALLLPSLRGALLRLTEDQDCAATVLPRIHEAGLHYYARQSSGAVLCFLRKWN